MKIAVAKGDGIGPEIMEAVLKIFDSAKVPLEYEYVDMGKWVFHNGFSNGMTPEAQHTIEDLGILFKGPMETPKGKGVKSVNVTAAKGGTHMQINEYFKRLHGVDSVFSKAGIPIDITIVRENIEDTYGGIEHMLTHDVSLSRRFITRPGSLQVIRYAFEMARKKETKRITCGHKANIMKITDGLFLECFYEVAKEFPELKADDVIVDDLCMKLVTRPDLFDVVVMTNLQGDIVYDLCAGLVGGLGFAPSANIGDHICIFEAVHGTAPDIAGKNIANPTALLLSGLAMLRHLGFMESAATIENSLLYTLEQGVHTGDFGDKSIASVNTTSFADAVVANFGQKPKQGVKPTSPDKEITPTNFKLDKNPMLVSKEMENEVIEEVLQAAGRRLSSHPAGRQHGVGARGPARRRGHRRVRDPAELRPPEVRRRRMLNVRLAQFGAGVVMDIMRTHPMVIIGGILQENPFFVPPDEMLREMRQRGARAAAE